MAQVKQPLSELYEMALSHSWFCGWVLMTAGLGAGVAAAFGRVPVSAPTIMMLLGVNCFTAWLGYRRVLVLQKALEMREIMQGASGERDIVTLQPGEILRIHATSGAHSWRALSPARLQRVSA